MRAQLYPLPVGLEVARFHEVLAGGTGFEGLSPSSVLKPNNYTPMSFAKGERCFER